MHKKRKARKLKKKKPSLSQEYRETESEVSNILKSKNLNSQNLAEISIQNEIDFFTFTLNTENLSTTGDDSPKEKSSIEPAEESVITGQTQPASSYIHIEDVTSSILPIQKIKINFNDDELLFIPSSQAIANIQLNEIFEQQYQHQNEDGIYLETFKISFEKNSNLTRMVNRYNEEKNFNVISTSNLLKNSINFTPHKILFKTDIDDNNIKRFQPILYSIPLSQIQENVLISKKLLTLTLKEVYFKEHPFQSDEHRLVNKLQDYYYGYLDKIQQNLISKLNYELQNIRQLIKTLMKNANENDVEKLEDLMKQTKILRPKLHREEQTLKNLIQNCLDTWILLKTCRKKQGFNYTDFKLIIKVEQVDFDEDEQLWNERFQIEMSEILREEYEKYYKDKRQRKLINRSNIDDIQNLRPLRKPDIENIKIDCYTVLSNCIRLPGDPKIELGHGYLEDRCNNLDKFKDYYFRIYFDGDFVGGTKNYKLTSDLKLQIDQSFGVYLEKRIPKEIRITVFEKSKLSSGQKIANIHVPIDITKDYRNGHIECIEFSSVEKHKISGYLKVIIYSADKFSEPNENFPIRPGNRSQFNKELLKNWYEHSLINPLDPDFITENLSEIDQQKHKFHDTLTDDNTFNFNEDCLLAFCTKDEIDNNQRFNMLRARYNKEMKYKDYKFIPLLENELEDENCEENVLMQGDWMDPIDLHKFKGKKYLRKLYDVIVNHCIQLNKDEDASNLLIGNDPPTFRSIIDAIMGFFGPSRPLNPPKISQISMSSKNLQNFNIVINIVRACGIPVRNFSHNLPRRNSSASMSTVQNLKYGNVRPYVCVHYKDKIARTMTADGSNPTYNEQLVLQISGNITELKDDLKFQIFDEYIEDLLDDENVRSMEVYQRIHANWLGEYRIPMNTIIKRQRIEGVFEIDIPEVLVGYMKPSLDLTEGEIGIDNIPEIRKTVYLWMYVSIEPHFEVTTLRTSVLECSELKEVKQNVHDWCIQIKELQSLRYLDPMICLATGKRVCLTRLFESIPIPFENVENSENLIRRFISLIPILKSSNLCLGLEGVWLNNQIILDTSWASAKDLGVLLACFYMNLGIRCWLALGIAYPYGDCAFVLINDELHYILIDPCTGKKYSCKDINCPLVIVQYIVGQDNIYCNLQRETRVSLTDFNINDRSMWMRMFGKNSPAPIGGVHKLNYNYRNSFNTNDLRKSIERKVMKKINTWRSTRKTIWNRGFYHILYDILIDLEEDAIHDRISENYMDRLSREFPNFKLFGFTLNFSYTNLSTISEKIKSTGIHLNTDRNVEFSVAVYIHQYTNNILSCWLFLLTIIP